MKYFILTIFLLLIVDYAANITQSVKISNIQQSTLPTSVTLNMSTSNSISKDKDLINSIFELSNLISKQYKDDFLLDTASTKANFSVEIIIEHFRYVSGFGRFMAGVMVGNAELRLRVKLKDLTTNKIMNESQLDTRSEFSEGIFGAITSRQLAAMAKNIVSIINSSAKNSE